MTTSAISILVWYAHIQKQDWSWETIVCEYDQHRQQGCTYHAIAHAFNILCNLNLAAGHTNTDNDMVV